LCKSISEHWAPKWDLHYSGYADLRGAQDARTLHTLARPCSSKSSRYSQLEKETEPANVRSESDFRGIPGPQRDGIGPTLAQGYHHRDAQLDQGLTLANRNQEHGTFTVDGNISYGPPENQLQRTDLSWMNTGLNFRLKRGHKSAPTGTFDKCSVRNKNSINSSNSWVGWVEFELSLSR
jgi:hypothetical protein